MYQVEPFIVKISLTLVMLLYTSLLDIRSREVDPKIWVYFAIPIYASFLYQVIIEYEAFLKIAKIHLIILLLITAVLGLLYYTGLLGGGDLFALFIIASTHPEINGVLLKGSPFPLSLQVLLFSSIIASFFSIYFCLYNMINNRDKLRKEPLIYKLILCFTAIALPVKDVVKKRFWYPLERPWSDEKLMFFKVEEDDLELIERLKEWAREYDTMNVKIWVTYGSPFLVYILIGYIMAIIGVGNYLLELAFRVI